MAKDETSIEVEVVEIDGVSQSPLRQPEAGPSAAGPRPQQWQGWAQWQGRVRTLDSRWWPLWVLLGILAAALILTVGVVLAALYLVALTLRAIFLALLAMFRPSSRFGKLKGQS